MAWNDGIYPATEGRAVKTIQGPFLFYNGAFCIQDSPAFTLTNSTTETSLLTGATGTTIAQPATGVLTNLGVQGMGQYPASSLILPGNLQGGISTGCLQTGTLFYFNFVGIIANTGTPTLRLRLGFVNQTTGVFSAIADTTAIAMSTVTGTGLLQVSGQFMPIINAVAGEVDGFVQVEYGPTNITIASPYGALSSFDTTQTYALDLRATWGAASASNTMTLKFGTFELVG